MILKEGRLFGYEKVTLVGNLFFIFVFSALAGQGISYGKVYLFHFFLFLNLLFLFVLHDKNQVLNFCKAFLKFNWELTLIILALLIYMLWFEKNLVGLTYVLYWLIGSITIFILSFYSSKNENLIIKGLVCFYLLQTIVSSLEFFGLFRMPISLYSNYNALFGKEVILSAKRIISLKASPNLSSGFFWHPNNSALFYLLVLPFQLLLRSRLGYITAALSLFIIYTTGSDLILALAGCYICVYSFQILYGNFSARARKISWAALVIFLITCLICLNVYYTERRGDNFAPKILGLIYYLPKFFYIKIFNEPFNPNDVQEAIRERFFWISSAIDLIRSNPLFGIGPNGIKSTSVFFENRMLPMWSIHCFWLEIMLMGGVFSFTLFFKWFFKIIRNISKRDNRLATTCLSSLILLFLGANVLSSAVYYLPMYVLFGFCVGIIIKHNFEIAEASEKKNAY